MFGFSKKDRINPEFFRFNRNIDKNTVIIHHYCPHTFNAGDHFVIRSIRNHLKERIPEALFVPKACAKNRGWGKPFHLAGKNIINSNKYAEAVIIGGSDQYNDWSLRIKKDEIKDLVPPLYLIGLGISSEGLSSEPRLSKEEYIEDIKATNDIASMSSVRDNVTYNFLKNTGINKHVMTGCPATYLFDRRFELKDSDYGLLTFPFPVVRTENKERYKKLINILSDLIKHLKIIGIRPIIVCHDDRDIPQALDMFPREEIFFSNYFEEYYELFENCRFVIGTRLHATILAAGMGKPFININLDLRGKGFSDTFGLENWNLNISDDSNILINKIYEKVERINSGSLAVFDEFYKVKNKYKKVFVKFIDDVAEDIRSRL